jgi:hypothetical protein
LVRFSSGIKDTVITRPTERVQEIVQ